LLLKLVSFPRATEILRRITKLIKKSKRKNFPKYHNTKQRTQASREREESAV
jgi:hypothetical protein